MSLANRISAKLRLSFGLVCLLITVLLLAMVLGLVPDRYGAVMDGRSALCEALAIQSSALVTGGDEETLEITIEAIVQRNADLLSAAVRRADPHSCSPDQIGTYTFESWLGESSQRAV